MELYLIANVDDFSNDVADLIRAFIPTCTVKMVDKSDYNSNNAILKYNYEYINNLNVFISASLCIETNNFSHSEHLTLPATYSVNTNKRMIKNSVKRCTYTILSSFTRKTLEWGILTGIRPTRILHQLLNDGFDYASIKGFMKNEYLVSEKKLSLLLNTVKNQVPILNLNSKDVISIYIHIPFCTSKCLYCSFPSQIIDTENNIMSEYINCLIYEIKSIIPIIKERKINIQNIYIGGGTPTSLTPELIDKLFKVIDKELNPNNTVEYTVEAGRVDTITEEKLKLFKNYGVNRISINPQTMNASTLKAIGRNHTPQEVIECFNAARRIGIGCINMDIILGLPNEDVEAVLNTLDGISTLQPDNLTIHILSIKRASVLKESQFQYKLSQKDTIEKMIAICEIWAKQNSYHPYYLYRQKYMLGNMENVGYSKPNKECIYNIQMMEERQSIIAFGAGSVTKLYYQDTDRIERIYNVKNINEYLTRIDEMIQKKINCIYSS